uniref:oligopeptide/dipeptide ABC transporter ATP-binding protein n=1 Tax=uncultured Enterovirga sp. TaxID=2026352 RepID=UPI0035C94E05
LKDEFGLTYIFISHDLNVVRFISDRVMVMYLGRVAELGASEEVFARARHPYTAALLSSMPSLDPDNRTEVAPLAGDPPNPIDPPSGCRFHTRCSFVEPVCSVTEPPVAPAGPNHLAACLMVQAGSGHSRAPAALEAAA